MKVDGPKPPKTGRPRPARSASEAAGEAGGRFVVDSASVMGIPEPELTPKVRSALMGLMEEVARLRDELERSHARIEHLERLADQDSLVPVYNRRAFVRELTRAISMTERYGNPSTVIYFDVDGMKRINDSLGHTAGDAALARVAECLKENVRDSDVVGRLGGDEFGVILFQADTEMARSKATLLVEKIESQPLVFNDDEISLTVAYGAYTFSGKEDAGQALAAADEAMYARKRDPKDKD